jgi:hypothetical protein
MARTACTTKDDSHCTTIHDLASSNIVCDTVHSPIADHHRLDDPLRALTYQDYGASAARRTRFVFFSLRFSFSHLTVVQHGHRSALHHSIRTLGIGTYEKLACVSHDEPLRDVFEVFESRHVSQLPVLNSTGKLIGIYGKGDIPVNDNRIYFFLISDFRNCSKIVRSNEKIWTRPWES